MTDDEAVERPVREQLKKASIDAASAVSPENLNVTNGASGTDAAQGRVAETSLPEQNHRPADHDADPVTEPKKVHGRKRSRDSAIDDPIPVTEQRSTSSEYAHAKVPNQAVPVKAASPKPDSTGPVSGAVDSAAAPLKSPASPRSKRKRTGERDGGNSSDEERSDSSRQTSRETGTADEPLTSDATPGPRTATASSSAFAASGFGALAASSASGFGALGGGKPLSSFASTSATTSNDKKTESAFGGATSSGFASLAPAKGASSGFSFGAGASGFGSLGTAKLTSFASPSGGDLGATKKVPTTVFGAPAKDDEEEGDEESDGRDDDRDDDKLAGRGRGEEKPDERFFEQSVETGEEGEETIYTCRAKLYKFVMSDEAGKKEWKERGLGPLRLNMTASPLSDEDKGNAGAGKPKARLVMRADGSHRVILNTPIRKEIKFGDVKGLPPQNGLIYFMGSVDDGKLELLQLKMRQQIAAEMHAKVVEVQQLM